MKEGILFASMILSVVVDGQVLSKGKCATFDSKNKFSFPQFYTGVWYVIEGYPNRYYRNDSCHQFSVASNDKYVHINESVFQQRSQEYETVKGMARFRRKKSLNRLTLMPGIKSLPYGADLWVIATDYNNYGVLYVCEQITSSRRKEYIYIVSRVPALATSLRAKIIIDNIVRGGFQVASLRPVDHFRCTAVDS